MTGEVGALSAFDRHCLGGAAPLCGAAFFPENDMPRRIKGRVTHVEPLLLNMEETAIKMGVSSTALYLLREKHELYEHDCEGPTRGEKGKGPPMWRNDKIELIVFARTKTPQGIRQYDDDFALQLWNKMQAQRDREYKKKAGYSVA